MSHFLGKFLSFLEPSPSRPARCDAEAAGDKATRPACKPHLRAMCEGILLKGDYADGWADVHDGSVGHAAW